MKRFGIFIFYEKYGTVNEYVKYLLKQMNFLLSECCIVCNGYVTDAGKAWLEANSDYVFYRENKGFDAGAYQDAILNRLGLSKLREFDELVLFNNSFYGPIYSFEEMFAVMEQRSIDFWGITALETKWTSYHIQTYFFVVGDRLLKSDTFEEYWRGQEECEIFQDAITKFELKITDFFAKQGFTCSAYIDYTECREEYGIEGSLVNAVNYELLVEKRCPIVKRKYVMNSLEGALAQNSADILSYINDNTDYHVEYIWEDLIKRHSPYELTTYRNLNNYLSDSISDSNIPSGLEDVCVVIDSMKPQQFLDYLAGQSCKVSIVVCTDEELPDYENVTILKRNGQSLPDLLVKARYLKETVQYFCVLRDSVIVRGKVAEKRRNNDICRKLISSIQYIAQVKRLFEQQPCLGALFTEELFDEDFLVQGFYKRYLSAEQAAPLEQAGCHVKIEEQCINHSGSFWVKADVLEVFEKNNMLCGHIAEQEISEMFPYFVMAAGYYSGILYNIDIAAKEYALKNILLSDLVDDVVFFDEAHLERQILGENILKFAKGVQGIYIYGAGKLAQRLIWFLERKRIFIRGIIVTSKKSESDFMGYPINEVDEVQLDEKTGIIVAMSQKNQKEVEKKLRMYPEKNVYYV